MLLDCVRTVLNLWFGGKEWHWQRFKYGPREAKGIHKKSHDGGIFPYILPLPAPPAATDLNWVNIGERTIVNGGDPWNGNPNPSKVRSSRRVRNLKAPHGSVNLPAPRAEEQVDLGAAANGEARL